jgi:hypothetical protein
MAEQASQVGIKLPDRIIGSVDLSRVIRELKAIDDWLNQASLRTPGQAMKVPKTTQSLEDLAALNGVSLLEPAQRTQFIELLEAFREHAPRIHMSFAVEPTARFTTTVIAWLRQNIHPLIMMEIGLQPTLAAGTMVRTTNKLFDMSLRNRFRDNRHLLVQKIVEVNAGKVEAPIAPTATPSATAAPAPEAAPAPLAPVTAGEQK